MPILTLSLTCQTPLRIADGDGWAVRRNPAGQPCIPATAIKGRLRATVEHIANGFDWPICGGALCYPLDGEPCAVCQLFGSRWREGRLAFSDLVTNNAPVMLDRQRAARSRVRGVSGEVDRFKGEMLPAGTILIGTLAHGLSADWQLALVIAGLHAMNTLGSSGALGWGAFTIAIGGAPDYSTLADALRVRVG